MAGDKRRQKEPRASKKPNPPKEQKIPKIGVCVYCGMVGSITDDHVPPENLFYKPKPPNLIKVPGCKVCNAGFSMNDEYFMVALLLQMGISGDPGRQELINKIMRLFNREKSQKLVRLFRDTFKRVRLVTPNGLYVGTATGYEVSLDRIRGTCSRILRGLYFEERGVRLPTDAIVACRVIDPPEEKLNLEVYRANLEKVNAQPIRIIGNGIFMYRFLLAEDEPQASLWLFNFYEKVTVMGISGPNKTGLSALSP